MDLARDFKKLIPAIVESLADSKHEIGETYWDEDEDGWGMYREEAKNTFVFEEGCWYVEAEYECAGEYAYDPGDHWTPPSCELLRASGSVRTLLATYCNEETGEEFAVDKEDLYELWDLMDAALKDIT